MRNLAEGISGHQVYARLEQALWHCSVQSGDCPPKAIPIWQVRQCSLNIHNLCMNYWIKSIESMISHSFVQCRATDDSGCQEEGGSVFLSICQGIFQYCFIFINALFSLLKGCPVFIGKLAIFVFVFHSYYPKSLILNIVPGRSRKGGFPLQNEHKYWTSTNIVPILCWLTYEHFSNNLLSQTILCTPHGVKWRREPTRTIDESDTRRDTHQEKYLSN